MGKVYGSVGNGAAAAETQEEQNDATVGPLSRAQSPQGPQGLADSAVLLVC